MIKVKNYKVNNNLEEVYEEASYLLTNYNDSCIKYNKKKNQVEVYRNGSKIKVIKDNKNN